MPRPRSHDLDALLDAAQQLAAESGAAAVTVRALSDRTSVSNGAIYHAFGSRAGLLGRVWLRAARRFLAVQQEAVDVALADTGGADRTARTGGADRTVGIDRAVEAVLAAADAPGVFLNEYPVAGRLLLTVDRAELLGSEELPPDLAHDLVGVDASLTALFIRLSRALWNRADGVAVSIIKDCVVEIPTALLLRGGRTPDRFARQRVAVAVRAILTLPPAPPPGSRSSGEHQRATRPATPNATPHNPASDKAASDKAASDNLTGTER